MNGLPAIDVAACGIGNIPDTIEVQPQIRTRDGAGVDDAPANGRRAIRIEQHNANASADGALVDHRGIGRDDAGSPVNRILARMRDRGTGCDRRNRRAERDPGVGGRGDGRVHGREQMPVGPQAFGIQRGGGPRGSRADLHLPVPAQAGRPGRVDGGGDDGAGLPRHRRDKGLPGAARADVAAIEIQRAAGPQRGADRPQRGLILRHVVQRENRVAGQQGPRPAMRDDRDRLQAVAARQGLGDLRQPVLVPVQQNDQGARRGGPRDLPVIGQAVVDEQDLPVRVLPRSQGGGRGRGGERELKSGRNAFAGSQHPVKSLNPSIRPQWPDRFPAALTSRAGSCCAGRSLSGPRVCLREAIQAYTRYTR